MKSKYYSREDIKQSEIVGVTMMDVYKRIFIVLPALFLWNGFFLIFIYFCCCCVCFNTMSLYNNIFLSFFWITFQDFLSSFIFTSFFYFNGNHVIMFFTLLKMNLWVLWWKLNITTEKPFFFFLLLCSTEKTHLK